MPLVPMKQLLEKADKGRYAVGAFNCNNMEIVQAIITAATEENSPVIVQASQGALKYAGIDYIVAMTKIAAENSHVPVALHLDHGTDFIQIMQCIAKGFTSVMIDGSKHSLDQNIAITNKVSEVARACKVSVEAELGKIGGTEDHITVSEKEAIYTDPQEALYFVKNTDIDALAIAIGTAHGQYKGEPKLDLKRLEKIRSLIDVPIVLHGSSGVPDQAIRAAIERGVSKINIDTNVREAFMAGLKDALAKNPQQIDPRKVLGPAKESMISIIKEKMRVFGSSGKA
ncbi:MAG: class II fructose-1,6-bisphosphate aldolase [Bacillota bacterium]|jgi:fructose-bisphosphate aldolase class II